MKNLNKFTKAELISKLNRIKPNNNKDNDSLITIIINFLTNFKGWILKLTLIAFMIKILKKYSIFRRLWRFTNWIAMTLLGFSITELWGVEYLSGLLDWIRSNPLTEVFKSKVGEFPTTIGGTSENSRRVQETTEKDSWFDGWNNKKSEPEIIEDNTPIYKNKYVITATVIALLALSWWYFQDDINPIIHDGIEKLQIFRSGTSNSPANNSRSSISHTESVNQSGWWESIKNKVKSLWIKDNKAEPSSPTSTSTSSIQCFTERDSEILSELKNTSLDKGKGIDLSNLSEQEQIRRIEVISKEVFEAKLLEQVTGVSQDRFLNQSEALIAKIKTFNNTEYFPTESLKLGMHATILGELIALKHLHRKYYLKWIEDKDIWQIIDIFTSSVKQDFTEEDVLKEGLDWGDANLNRNVDLQSETYNEVALATSKEQDIWSDKASIYSPVTVQDNFSENAVFDQVEQTEIPELKVKETKTSMSALFDSIKARRDDTNVVSDVESGKFNVYRAGLTPGNEPIILKTEVETLDQALDIGGVKEEPSVRKPEIITEIQPVIESIPVTKNSTPESMDKYFRKPDVLGELIDDAKVLSDQDILENVKKSFSDPVASTSQIKDEKPMFSALFDSIRKRRDDTNVVEGGNKPTIKTDNIETIVEKPKSKFSSLFDAINARRDDTNVVENITKFNTPKIETREEILRQVETLPVKVETPKSALSGILESVKGLLTPKTVVKYPETDNLFDDTNALFEDNEDDTQDNETDQTDMLDWKDVKVNIVDHKDIFQRRINIDFRSLDLTNKIGTIEIRLSDGSVQNISPLGTNITQTIHWFNKGINYPGAADLEVYSVAVNNNEGRHVIYRIDVTPYL